MSEVTIGEPLSVQITVKRELNQTVIEAGKITLVYTEKRYSGNEAIGVAQYYHEVDFSVVSARQDFIDLKDHLISLMSAIESNI